MIVTRVLVARVATLPAAATIGVSSLAFFAGPFAGVIAVGVTAIVGTVTSVLAFAVIAMSIERLRRVGSLRQLRLGLWAILVGSFATAVLVYQTAFIGWGTGPVAAHGLLAAMFVVFAALSAVIVRLSLREPRSAALASVSHR